MSTVFSLPPTLRYAAIKFSSPASWQNNISYRVRFISTISIADAPGRTYADAIRLLNTLQSNRAVVASISNATLSASNKNDDAIPEMLEWARRAGYDVSDFATRGLRCIHVAGTKGKGSVCAMVENILLQYRHEEQEQEQEQEQKQTEVRMRVVGKVGLYTSPHLVTPRERIRIDGSPLSEALFTRYFFELWDRFSNAASKSTSAYADPQSSDNKPGYFRYLTLMAFHVFINEGVKTAIIECGIGGEYDSTNILPPDAVSVTAITKLGIDHVGMLGETIGEIAWHKAGIMKKLVPVFSMEQSAEAQIVLNSRAQEKGLMVEYVKRRQDIDSRKLRLGLEGDFQEDNASLAIAVARSHLHNLNISAGLSKLDMENENIPDKFVRGLETVRLQARCEVRREGNIEWLIDGAHTHDSMLATASWYSSRYRSAQTSSKSPLMTMLIFNQQDRDASSLLKTLLTKVQAENASTSESHHGIPFGDGFTYAVFCRNTPFKADVEPGVNLELQEQTSETYQKLNGKSLSMIYASIEEAIDLARKVAENEESLMVLVTGSLHLAGGLIEVLDKQSH